MALIEPFFIVIIVCQWYYLIDLWRSTNMNIALILAAGSGTRMGNGSVPKQFLEIYNKPIVVHTIEQFEMHFDIDEIVIVTKKEYID